MVVGSKSLMTARGAVARLGAGPGAAQDLDPRDLDQGPGAREAAPDLEVGRRVAPEATSPAPSLQARAGSKESPEASPDPRQEASLVIEPSLALSLAPNLGASRDQDPHPKKNPAPDPGLAP